MNKKKQNNSFFNIEIFLDAQQRLKKVLLAKSYCSRLRCPTRFSEFCRSKTPEEILASDFGTIESQLGIKTEEEKFVLLIEWDALRCALVLFLGQKREDIDTDRCQNISIEETTEGTKIFMELLSPDAFLPLN